MPDAPDQQEQIRRMHARFICQVAEVCADPRRRGELDALLQSAAQSGWGALAAALRLIGDGQRGPAVFAGLDPEDRVIVESVLRGLQDPASLPDPDEKPDPALAAPGLAHMIYAASRGNAEALVLVGNMAEQMQTVGGSMARLAGAIRPLINGERDPDRLCRGMNAQTQQLVLDILRELGRLEPH